MTDLLASIPSPSTGTIGPLHAYGLMIALGVLAAAWLMGRRLEHDRIGVRDDAYSVAMWAVPAGVVGARLYHVVTQWEDFKNDLPSILKIWQGGLGIWGGIAVGVAAGVWAGRRKGLPLSRMLACAVPGLPLAQAIGRWGNWWNQELFGRPTTLPWSLRISPEHRPDQYLTNETFHPTFLYESLWNLLLCVGLLWYDRRHNYRLRGGRMLALYAMGYTLARFFIEGLRVDRAHSIGGLRVNEWVSIVVFVLSAAYLAGTRNRRYVDPLPAGGSEEGLGVEEPGDDGVESVESFENGPVDLDDGLPQRGDL